MRPLEARTPAGGLDEVPHGRRGAMISWPQRILSSHVRGTTMTPTYDPALYATERRAILFVDAGYLLQVMKAHHGASRLSDLRVDHPKLIEVLRTRAESALGCPVLRIYWYDAE